MSNRKESLKKSLGISEYPWSSDDEVESENPQATPEARAPLPSRHRNITSRESQSRPSVGELPGTSGVESTSAYASGAAADAMARKRQARMDRAIFWTILNSPRSNISSVRGSNIQQSRSSIREVPGISGVSRSQSAADRPTEDLASRGALVESQRLLSLERLTNALNNRYCGGFRHPRPNTKTYGNVYSQVSRQNGRPERTRDSAPTNRGITLHYGGNAQSDERRRQLRPFIGLGSDRTDRINFGTGPTLNQAVLDEPQASSSGHSHSMSGSNVSVAGSNVDHVNLDQSDDGDNEDEDIMPPVAMSSPNASNENNVDHESAATQVEGQRNVSGMSLEEEIVEIVDPESETAAVDTGNTSGQDNVDNPSTHNQSGDNNANANQEATPQPQVPHGVKRKRDEVDSESEQISVKEFNQSLLRLLECPVCLEWMEPPIVQCRRGHLVCARCRSRLVSCPVCRTVFSSVRNRAMEGVSELLRYPCRHGCGREVRLRRRGAHEASCAARRYRCPAPACDGAPPHPLHDLANHFQSQHMSILKMGQKHEFSIKVDSEKHDNWIIMAHDELFHLRMDVDFGSWGVAVYVDYIGPKCNATKYTYEVTVNGQRNSRKLVYTRSTHCDLECSSLNVTRQDCFHLTLDQAVNFIVNRHCVPYKYLNFTVEINQCEGSDEEES